MKFHGIILVFLIIFLGVSISVRVEAGDEPLAVTVKDAILMALENNRSLNIQRINPEIRKTYEEQAQAEFDPLIDAGISASRERLETISRPQGSVEDNLNINLAVEKFFATGTTILVEGDSGGRDSSLYNDPFVDSRLGLTFTQALLRGYGTDVNLAELRQARLDTYASWYELRGYSESLLNQVESAYWDYALAVRQIQIVEESLQVAEQHMNETQEMINVGKLAESELIAVQAEIASRRQELIEAHSNMEVSRLRFLRLLNPPGSNPFKREVRLLSRPDLNRVPLDEVESHVSVGLKMRPDLNEARLGVQKNDVRLVKTKNGLLPKLDFFITLGKTGYANSFDGSIGDISGDYYDAQAGIKVQYPVKNRRADAEHRRALFNRDQAERSLKNLEQLVELDVRGAYIEVNRAWQQISASSETRKLDEEKLRIEAEKFKVGRSTNFLVAQAQRDLLSRQILEVRAVANYLKALTELFRLEGSLLERRGISVPGSPPPD